MHQPLLSIIIPTYLRTAPLWETLVPLFQQMAPEDELIIVDQNVPPLTIPDSFRDQSIRFFHQSVPSLTKARNLGMRNARNPNIYFLDDDIIPGENLLTSARKALTNHPGCIIAGSVDQDDKPTVEGIGFANLRNGEVRTNYGELQIEQEVPFFAGCNFILPGQCTAPDWSFNQAFRGSAQKEEIDFALRARNRGIKIVFCPEASIFHRKLNSGGCRSDSYQHSFLFDNCFNEGLFFGTHGRLLFIFHFLKRMRNFTEFHTRNRENDTHDWMQVFRAVLNVLSGLAKGIWCRFKCG